MNDHGFVVKKFDMALVDRRPLPELSAERTRVKEQVTNWRRLQQDPDHRAKDRRTLIARREGRRDLAQVEAVENDGVDTFVAAGELLITKKDLEGLDERQRGLLAELGLVASTAAGLRGGIVVLGEGDPRASRVRGRTRDVAARLREAGLPVRPNYIVPLGMVRKAEGGPELSSWKQDKPAATVSGPMVAVIDTGISVEERGDGWLHGQLRSDNVDLLDVIPQPTDGKLDLGAGHGTFVSGAIQQVAPGVDLRIYQALDTDGLAAESTVAAAIVAAVEDGAKILNLSFGTDTLDGDPPLSLRTAVETAIATDPDVLLVCAAGNTGDTRDVWPAAFHKEFPSNVVSVAALAVDGAAGADWSTHGDVTCSTIGEGVVSTYVKGTESHAADTAGPDTFGDQSWATWSGTSFAAPQIVGAIAKVLQDPAHSGKSPRQALDVVLQNAVQIPDYGKAVHVLPA